MRRLIGSLSLAALLAGCGGGDGSGGGGTTAATGTTTTASTTATGTGCSLLERQTWAAAQLNEWYLFPETLPTALSPSAYTTVSAYVDALTATARAQGRDRYFTYLTSIASEDAYYNSGSSAGFGFRLSTDATSRRLFVAETFEGTPALAAGIDRGAEIVGIGTSASTIRTVSAIIAAEGTAGITTALGDSTAGTTRVLRVIDRGGTATRDVSVAKADYSLTPVSARYGAQVLNDGGKKVGYVNLRTFINTADPALRAAFASFKAAGVSDVIVDLRYNGGGLVSIAELLGNLLGGARTGAQVQDRVVFRTEKAANNSTTYFATQAESVAPARIAFIGTGGTASASELTVNAQIPYYHGNAALIGTNTYGKPVGQIALDRSQCDDRLRVIAFATVNADGTGGYYNGLAGTVQASCQAGDDLTHQLGDPAEGSTRAALDFIEGKSCTPIAAGQTSAAASGQRTLLTPDRPDTPQRETPGLF